MVLGEVTNNIINKAVENFYNVENRQKLKRYVLTPVASYIEDYLKPYFLTLVILLLAIVLLLIYNTKLLLDISKNGHNF